MEADDNNDYTKMIFWCALNGTLKEKMSECTASSEHMCVPHILLFILLLGTGYYYYKYSLNGIWCGYSKKDEMKK